MAMKPQIGSRQTQRLGLTPQMRQSLQILRMPVQELLDAIAREAAENPFLEVGEHAAGGRAYDYALATTEAPTPFHDSLVQQIEMQRLGEPVRAAALLLVAELRRDGYLDTPLELLAERFGAPPALMEQALRALQGCEPAGVGARDLVECLALQLVDLGVSAAHAPVIAAHLGELPGRSLAALQRRLGVPAADLRTALAHLSALRATPVPEDHDWVATVIPEIAVERGRDGSLSASFLGGSLPDLSVMAIPDLSAQAEDIRRLAARARAMVAGVAARRRTLLRIAELVLRTQPRFFLDGRASIVPQTQAEAAAELGLHPSTLGRAIAAKALIANDRVYPFSLFFSRALPGPGGAVSAFDVQQRIRGIVDGEDPHAPLTDSAIQHHLAKEGVDISRRTVAKYRKCMRIPSSSRRVAPRQTMQEGHASANRRGSAPKRD